MTTDNKTEVWGSSTHGRGPGWGYGYGYRGYRGGWGWGGGHSTVRSYNYTEATYVIDMVDAKSDELVWRSHSTMKLNNNNKDAKRIKKMANRAFKKSPAGQAAVRKS
jgi:CubicO group peptidase (beta-lactamase class C family)